MRDDASGMDPTGQDGAPVELTEGERAALAALPRERAPGALLEERVVRALRAEGILAPRGRRWRAGGGWWAAAVAAGLALFAGGVAVGQALTTRTTADMLAAVRASDAQVTAAMVQQTGSAYVAALSALANQRGAGGLDAADARQGSEVALTALSAAAAELARLDPDNAVARQVVRLTETASAEDAAEPRRQVIWF